MILQALPTRIAAIEAELERCFELSGEVLWVDVLVTRRRQVTWTGRGGCRQAIG